MKAIFTVSLFVMGLAASRVEAGHANKANFYATAVDKEAHHLDEDMHQVFPHSVGLLKKVHRFTALAHATQKMVLHRQNLSLAEYNIDLMQQTLGSIDANLHHIANHQPPFQRKKTAHLLRVVHKLESYLDRLEDEVHELNRVVILPYQHHGYGQFHGYGNNHVVIRPAGIYFHKGGFNLNLPF